MTFTNTYYQIIKKGVKSSANNTIVNIASAGGGLVKIAEHLKKNVPNLKIILTDYYPNIDAFKKTKAQQPTVFEYIEDSINAMSVPLDLKGFRTQFLSFHHFKPIDAKAILQNVVDNNQPIGIFETQQRSFKNLLQRFLSPISVLLLTLFIKLLNLTDYFLLILFLYYHYLLLGWNYFSTANIYST